MNDEPPNSTPTIQSGSYRLECKYVALTYADCDRLDRESLHTFLTTGLGKIPCYTLVARELHESGAQHFHALLFFSGGIRTRKSRFFDVDGVHPNVQSCRDPKAWYQYCKKDGDVREFGVLPPKLGDKSGDWSECLVKATSRDDFLERVRVSFARDWIIFNDRITSFADKYFVTPSDYCSPELDYIIPEPISEWRRVNLQEVSVIVQHLHTCPYSY
uniref:Replication-associated protein n=1 Tax=Phoenicopteridae CRESS-DNA-virus sp. TaxID=2815051 RepID=A0A8A4XD52_9VIRU|nr:MAG: replication-associated protein [Phoenicopteridae CRESS-DNA-virus sp.]